MAHSSPSEERYLHCMARAEESRMKAEAATDLVIRAWWEQSEQAWLYLAEQALSHLKKK
jgi:hypothetical protein